MLCSKEATACSNLNFNSICSNALLACKKLIEIVLEIEDIYHWSLNRWAEFLFTFICICLVADNRRFTLCMVVLTDWLFAEMMLRYCCSSSSVNVPNKVWDRRPMNPGGARLVLD